MIKEEDIKVGSVLQIRKVDLKNITDMSFIHQIDPNDIYDTFAIKVVGIENERCEIELAACAYVSTVADIDKLAKVSFFANEFTDKKAEQVSHPSHYAWLKDLCGVEPLDICRHLDFNTGNAIKYLLRKDKVDGNKTKTEKRVEDLRKAVFYIQDEIKLLEHGTD
nr:MAG TPA: nucelotide kinase [Caudoviricetes sp.]